MSEHARLDETKAVLAPLEDIERLGFSRFDVFRDWTHLMVHALARDDDSYLESMSRYDKANERHEVGCRPADSFSLALGELMQATSETNRDVLGDVYEAYGVTSDQLGQHFTPHGLCAMTARLSIGPTAPEGKGQITVSDPACGSGRFFLAAARQATDPVLCMGVDRDGVCARMAALNCCLFNLDAAIVHGDSLTFESFGAWRTRSTPMGGAIEPVDPADVGFVKPDDGADVPAEQADSGADEQAPLGEWAIPGGGEDA